MRLIVFVLEKWFGPIYPYLCASRIHHANHIKPTLKYIEWDWRKAHEHQTKSNNLNILVCFRFVNTRRISNAPPYVEIERREQKCEMSAHVRLLKDKTFHGHFSPFSNRFELMQYDEHQVSDGIKCETTEHKAVWHWAKS